MLQSRGSRVSSEEDFEGGMPTLGMFGLVLELDDDWELELRGSK